MLGVWMRHKLTRLWTVQLMRNSLTATVQSLYSVVAARARPLMAPELTDSREVLGSRYLYPALQLTMVYVEPLLRSVGRVTAFWEWVLLQPPRVAPG